MSSVARESYLRQAERKRRTIAWGGALVLYLLFGLGVVLEGLLGRESLSMNPGPIQVRIGTPEGLDETSRTLPALRTAPPAAPPPPAPSPAVPSKPEAAPAVTSLAQAKPQAAKSPGAQVPAPPLPEVAMPATRLARDPGAEETQGEGIPSGVLGGSGSVSLKGSEAGNSFETNLGGGGSIGRALFVPIYLYMPLPLIVPDSIYTGIKASPDGFISVQNRQLQFRSHYEKVGDRWRLKKEDVALPSRPGLWAVLESGGFDLRQADYKRGGSLRPVVLDFELNPYDPVTKSTSLRSVEIRSGSGDKEIDDAVVYGFRQGGFSNGSQKIVRATFTYRFD